MLAGISISQGLAWFVHGLILGASVPQWLALLVKWDHVVTLAEFWLMLGGLHC